MKAGTNTMRTTVASTITASVRPTPNIRMNETSAEVRAANEIDINRAAAVMIRPVRATPKAMLSSLSTSVRGESSQYSRIGKEPTRSPRASAASTRSVMLNAWSSSGRRAPEKYSLCFASSMAL